MTSSKFGTLNKYRGAKANTGSPLLVMKMKLTSDKYRRLHDLWFVYGNNGKHHTLANHKWIQHLLQGNDYRDFYKPTPECVAAVERILSDD